MSDRLNTTIDWFKDVYSLPPPEVLIVGGFLLILLLYLQNRENGSNDLRR